MALADHIDSLYLLQGHGIDTVSQCSIMHGELTYTDTWGSIYKYDGSLAHSQMDLFDKYEKAYRHNFL